MRTVLDEMKSRVRPQKGLVPYKSQADLATILEETSANETEETSANETKEKKKLTTKNPPPPQKTI